MEIEEQALIDPDVNVAEKIFFVDAVFFDMDGLLVDTETLGIEVAVKVCGELGFEIDEEEQRNFIGVTDEKFYKELFEKRQLVFNVENVLARHFELYEQLLETDLREFKGANTLPKKLKEFEFKLALVSGSTRHQIDIILKKLGIADCFDVIISYDDITESKPNPEGYLMAAARLGINPGQCLVLEDARSGIKAGISAGMKVLGVVNSGGQDVSAADFVVQDLSRVDAIRGKVIAKD